MKNEVFVPGDLILYFFNSVKLSLLFFYTKDLHNIMFTYIILTYLVPTFGIWGYYRTTVCLYISVINNRCNMTHYHIRINYSYIFAWFNFIGWRWITKFHRTNFGKQCLDNIWCRIAASYIFAMFVDKMNSVVSFGLFVMSVDNM